MDGLYLRYIPQQWLALIPARGGREALPGSRSYIQLANELYAVSQVAGWSTTMDFGSIASLTSQIATGTTYATIALASPPMPTVTGALVIDGGCYRVFDGAVTYPQCDGESCFECARFGRVPTQAELDHWKKLEADHPELWNNTVMIDDLEEPYPCGMWSGYTQQAILARQTGKPYNYEDEGRRGPSLRPRLMPQEVKLPAGVTCCVMPAGTYLCRQCDEGGQNTAHSQLTGIALSMPRRVFTVEEEIERFNAFEATERKAGPPGQRQQKGKGPIIEPFAAPRSPGDPKMSGWSRMVDQPDIHKLTLPMGTALQPEDGFCIRCNTLPVADPNAPTRYEFSMLVECPQKMMTPPRENG